MSHTAPGGWLLTTTSRPGVEDNGEKIIISVCAGFEKTPSWDSGVVTTAYRGGQAWKKERGV